MDTVISVSGHSDLAYTLNDPLLNKIMIEIAEGCILSHMLATQASEKRRQLFESDYARLAKMNIHTHQEIVRACIILEQQRQAT